MRSNPHLNLDKTYSNPIKPIQTQSNLFKPICDTTFLYPRQDFGSMLGTKTLMTTDRPNHEAKGEIPGRVTSLEGRRDLPMVAISTGLSTPEISRHRTHGSLSTNTTAPPYLFSCH